MRLKAKPVKKTVNNGKIIKRTTDGKIAKGSAALNSTGKRKGTLNKFTTLKKSFFDAFEQVNDVDGLVS